MHSLFSKRSARSRTGANQTRPFEIRSNVAAQNGRVLIIALVALAALLAGLIIARGLLEQSVELQAASIYPEARTLAPFELEDATGSAFTEDDLRGRLSLLFFGFTNCPDIC